MRVTKHFHFAPLAVLAFGGLVACDNTAAPSAPTSRALASRSDGEETPFRFEPLASSAVCTVPGGDPVNPLVLPSGYTQRILASEPAFDDLIDMNTQNETGPQAGRFLYRVTEVGSNGSLSVTDLVTGATRTVVQRADWERLDGIVWTPWGTIVTGEETSASKLKDPLVPQATAGLMYEIDPRTGVATVLPALGSRAHEGMRFDRKGNLYGISERAPGYIYKFVPDRRRDLSSGQLYALRVDAPTGDGTGAATWIPLDRDAVQVNSDAAALAAGATGYARPEDIETGTSTGNSPDGANVLYVAVTGEDRVLAIDLGYEGGRDRAFVYEYARAGVNAPADFKMPDNLALDRAGNLYIAEDPGGNFPAKTTGDDIWRATPAAGNAFRAERVVRFATLTDCDAEPTGIYFSTTGDQLFVNVQHRGGDGRDLAMAISRVSDDRPDDDDRKDDRDDAREQDAQRGGDR